MYEREKYIYIHCSVFRLFFQISQNTQVVNFVRMQLKKRAPSNCNRVKVRWVKHVLLTQERVQMNRDRKVKHRHTWTRARTHRDRHTLHKEAKKWGVTSCRILPLQPSVNLALPEVGRAWRKLRRLKMLDVSDWTPSGPESPTIAREKDAAWETVDHGSHLTIHQVYFAVLMWNTCFINHC